MAGSGRIGAVLVLAAAFAAAAVLGGAQAQAPPAAAPGPAAVLDCLTVVMNMSDCLSFVEGGSNLTRPEKPCCPELAGLLGSNPICLCQLLANSSGLGIQIDVDRAKNLPNLCKLTTPPPTTCSAFGYPVPGPSSGPSLSPGMMPPGSAEGSAASPGSERKDGSGAAGIVASTLVIFAGLGLALTRTVF